eukprot:3406664-Alexandrium_andersonii.AAC.1
MVEPTSIERSAAQEYGEQSGFSKWWHNTCQPDTESEAWILMPERLGMQKPSQMVRSTATDTRTPRNTSHEMGLPSAHSLRGVKRHDPPPLQPQRSNTCC